MKNTFKVSICQMNVADNKGKNIKKAIEMLETSAKGGADLAVLPEMFNCPYDSSKFRAYAEKIGDSRTIMAVSKAARELKMSVIAGSIPEEDNGRIYNTCCVIGKSGEIIARHRKMHLFDIDVEGKISFKESDTLDAGDKITVVDTEYCRIGVAICYDIRFPELHRLMALDGAKLIVIPGAFNMITGPAHWEPLVRIRALDNQVYVAAASPARNEDSSYIAYGNSMIAGPWGEIIARAGEKEEVIFADIDLSRVEKIRNELPLLKHRRTDVYQVKNISDK